MKRNISYILLLAAAAVVFSSCKDDDDEKTSNKITIESDASIIIRSATLRYDPVPEKNPVTGEDIYFHHVVFMSEGLTVKDEGKGLTLSGEGDALSLGLVSSTMDLEPGTYEFNQEEDAARFDFFEGLGVYDVNTQDEWWLVITGGIVTVSKEDNTYTIDFNGRIDDTLVKSHYKGILTKIQED